MTLSEAQSSQKTCRAWWPDRSYAYPLALAAFIRIVGAFFVWNMLKVNGSFRTYWMSVWSSAGPRESWLYIFSAFDSGHYVAIAKSGYYDPMFVFMPMYPMLIRLAGLAVPDLWAAAFAINVVFAFASIPVFQRVAELYLPKREALISTLIFIAFPYVSLFSILSYTESLFIFFTLSTWYAHKKNRHAASFLMAGAVTLTKLYGIFIILPIAIDLLRAKNYRAMAYASLPISVLLAWFAFCYYSTGDMLASLSEQSYWMAHGMIFNIIQKFLIDPLESENTSALPIALLFSLFLFTYLIVSVSALDTSLWTYSAALFTGFMFLGTAQSILRYASFIFPIWLGIKSKSLLAAAIYLSITVPFTIVLWVATLQGNFVA